MGFSSACQIFERFSTALEWIGKRHMPEGVIIHILDHFFYHGTNTGAV
jgi:maltoporin